MKKSILLLSTLIFFFTSCGDDEPVIEPKGSIFVTVKYNWELVSDAQITTEPITSMVETDLTGTAIITEVPIGGYKVNATHPDIGTGSASVTVTENAVMDVTINLIGGVFENPMVTIQSPTHHSSHNLGEEIEFSALVGDESDAPNALSLVWESSIDGTLNEDPANASGQATFSTNTLSEGDHTITLTAVDSDELQTSDEINISVAKLPDAVTLHPITVSTGGLELSWTESTEAEFASYRITRSEDAAGPFQVIGVVSDLTETSYTDSEVMFGIRYYYQIAVVLSNGDESLSNMESQLYEGEHIDLGVNIVRMKMDPSRPYIYAIDQINNSMLFINKESRSVEKTIFVGSSPSDIAINMDGSKAYIANFGSTQIAVIDLDTQEKIDDLFVDTQSGSWDGNPYRLACISDNLLVWVTKTSWATVRLINAETGTLVQAVNGSYSAPCGLVTTSDKEVLFATEAGNTGAEAKRLNYSQNTLTEVDNSDGNSNWNGHDAPLSGDDKYLFYNYKKLLANNLNSNLGSFTEHIRACNHDGSIAIGEENIWDAETFSIIKPLPISSEIMRLDQDDNTIYIYDNNTSKIYITTIE